MILRRSAMLTIILAILVVVGFIFWFLATWPTPHAERIARGFFLLASIVWAYAMLSGSGAH
jgi:hypothetical protein